MDMKANLGSFAAALKDKDVWVMNVVPEDGPNTLKVIYDRGLIGTVHNWYVPQYILIFHTISHKMLEHYQITNLTNHDLFTIAFQMHWHIICAYVVVKNKMCIASLKCCGYTIKY